MGIISDLASGKSAFPGMNRGREMWDNVFGNKPTSLLSKPDPHVVRPYPGGSYGRSMLSQAPALMRLIQAMRSMAPGGWSDNRWEQTRQFVGIAYLGIHRICTQWMQSEFQVFEEDDLHPDGKRPVRKGHPGWELVELLKNPNRQDSWGQHAYRLGQNKYLTGTALTWKASPTMDMKPHELYCLPTAIAIPQPAINPDYPDGYYRIQPVYPYGPFSSYPTPSSSVGAPVPAQWVIRSQFPHPLLRYDGYSPLTGLGLELDEARSVSKSRWYKMLRTLNPEAVLQFEDMDGAQPLPWEEIERIHAELFNEQQGPENAGRVIVSTPGARLEPWGANPKEMDYPNSWDQITAFCLAGLGISKAAAGMTDDASYANLWASLKQLHLLVLKADLDSLAADYTKHLAPHFGERLIVEIRCPRIDDWEQKLQRLDKAVQGKCIKKGELRKELDLPVLNEPWEDEFAGEGEEEKAEAIGLPGEPSTVRGGTVEKQEEKLPTKKPDTGDLGRGSLGPRVKRLSGTKIQTKSLYNQLRAVCTNGSH